jgi:hypothetical protein
MKKENEYRVSPCTYEYNKITQPLALYMFSIKIT